MREAFIKTLNDVLGNVFTHSNKVIWTKAYNMMRNIIEDRDVDDDDTTNQENVLDEYQARLV